MPDLSLYLFNPLPSLAQLPERSTRLRMCRSRSPNPIRHSWWQQLTLPRRIPPNLVPSPIWAPSVLTASPPSTLIPHSRRSESTLVTWELSPLPSGLLFPSPPSFSLAFSPTEPNWPLPLDPSTLGYPILVPWYPAVPSGYPVQIRGLNLPHSI